MSDYAAAVTEPLWPTSMPDVCAYFRDWTDWTEIAGDKGSVAFAGLVRDVSEAGIHAQLSMICADLEKRLPGPAWDLALVVVYDGGRCEKFSAHGESLLTELNDSAIERRIAELAEGAERDRQANEGSTNPDLDAFLDATLDPTDPRLKS